MRAVLQSAPPRCYCDSVVIDSVGGGAIRNRHAAVKLGAKYYTQRFSIDWLARALQHNERANLVVR
jgi:hypothetical protein